MFENQSVDIFLPLDQTKLLRVPICGRATSPRPPRRGCDPQSVLVMAGRRSAFRGHWWEWKMLQMSSNTGVWEAL